MWNYHNAFTHQGEKVSNGIYCFMFVYNFFLYNLAGFGSHKAYSYTQHPIHSFIKRFFTTLCETQKHCWYIITFKHLYDKVKTMWFSEKEWVAHLCNWIFALSAEVGFGYITCLCAVFPDLRVCVHECACVCCVCTCACVCMCVHILWPWCVRKLCFRCDFAQTPTLAMNGSALL